MASPQFHVIIEADGGCRGNPGPAGYGAIVSNEAGDILAERAQSIGSGTSNVAEYSGLIAGLRAAVELGATSAEVRMDSKLVVEQMSGRWKIRHPRMRDLAAESAGVARGLNRVSYVWVPRAQNYRADALANQALDAAANCSAPAESYLDDWWLEPPCRS